MTKKNQFPIPFEDLFENFRSHLLDELFKDKLMNMTPDYTPQSLGKIEQILIEKFSTYGKELPEKIWYALIPVGFYYGETIVKNVHGAFWKINNDELLQDQMVAIPTNAINGYNTVYVKPFAAVCRWCISQEKSLWELFNDMMIMTSA